MIPVDFDYHLFGTHVRFGEGAAHALGDELRARGLKRPAVLTQDRIASAPPYVALLRSLDGMAVLQRAGIPAHSSVSLIETMAPEIAAFGADCLVAVGGGSVADTAKALALLLAEGGRLADHVTVFQPPSTVYIPRRIEAKLPIIAVPTTASGAETTSSFGVRDGGHDKLMFWNRQVSAAAILIDPLLSQDVPLATMRYTAMNGVAHCLESLYSKGRSVVSDGMAMQGVALFAQALGSPLPEETVQRRLILAAAHVSGMALAMARSCLHHAICHVVGARLNLPHGLVNTVILPHALRFNETVAGPLLAPALDCVNRSGARSARRYDSLSDWLARTADDLDLPRRLRDLGVPADVLPDIAGHVMTERGLALNPRPVAVASDVLAILRQAF
ncbi:iron-containing alcohol dehydrogenase [Bordetella genomosp. 9]|uniref:Iron-containing alcohol dehydrogenase n=1 Tax=Bordetella genomosp. 9 TaxID=1416803 RepID=A0A261R8W5_9BORD|nr:iron-containing alcohol dehydrogenase [Bordetella genomosp. 9]OZI21112.1 iron-containing alcohol dehydrogenase [Bordetella genomosp. 9]